MATLIRKSVLRPFRYCIAVQYSTSTTTATPSTAPMLMIKVRNDMKAAMKAKDTTRLDVLRGLISEITNAAKTANPVTTDSHMLKIIRKRVKSSEGAVTEFQNAKREDLMAKEKAQIQVLEEYIQNSDVMSEEDMTKVIQDVIGNMRTEEKKTDKGSVMKALVGPGGALDGQLVDRKDVARVAEGML